MTLGLLKPKKPFICQWDKKCTCSTGIAYNDKTRPGTPPSTTPYKQRFGCTRTILANPVFTPPDELIHYAVHNRRTCKEPPHMFSCIYSCTCLLINFLLYLFMSVEPPALAHSFTRWFVGWPRRATAWPGPTVQKVLEGAQQTQIPLYPPLPPHPGEASTSCQMRTCVSRAARAPLTLCTALTYNRFSSASPLRCFCLPGTAGGAWGHFWLSQLEVGCFWPLRCIPENHPTQMSLAQKRRLSRFCHRFYFLSYSDYRRTGSPVCFLDPRLLAESRAVPGSPL